MKRWIVHFGVLCLALLAACARDGARTAETEQQAAPVIVTFPEHFDLGGPCLLPGAHRPVALTGRQEDELRKAGKWDAIIDGARQNVRNSCLVPYRWERLFGALVQGHRYHEAVQVLADMAMRGFPLPHSIISSASPDFLASAEFRNSEPGIEYAATESDNQRNLRAAGSKLASMAENIRPPNPYRAIGACPFECCTYREWKTTAAVQLRESITSGIIVGEVPADAVVQGLTGEVWVEPEPYAVLRDVGLLKAGDVIFVLDYLGEGHANYWHDGKLNPQVGLVEGMWTYLYENCSSNNRTPGKCSFRKLHPEKKFLNEWWVRIRTSAGKEGWVLNKGGLFSNVDACG